jgi:integrase
VSKTPGNLYQRGDVWWILYYVNGRRVRRSLETTSQKEAKRLRDEILGVRAGGDRIRAKFGIAAAANEGAPVPTIAEVADSWMTAKRIAKRATNTLDTYEDAVECWIKPELGQRRVGDVSRADVRAFVDVLRKAKGREGRKMSDDRVSFIFGRLRAIYLFARREGLWTGIDPTDLDKHERPQPGKGRDTILTIAEAQRFLAELDGRWYYMASVALYAGLAVGEVNGLAWGDVDLDAGTLTVRRSYAEGTTKSTARADTIPLHRDLVALLRTWQEICESDEWVFPSRGGRPKKKVTPVDYRVLRRAASAAEIKKRVTWHTLRHSYGTALYEQNPDPKALQALMRHADIRITLSRYVHPDRSKLADKVNALPSILKPRLRVV